ncbi:cysteine--tRNA ligase [bacterium]|nr:cysteine--tRNA ligase [bacterium]
MPLRVYNTLTGDKQPFEPLTPGKVGMYVCGVTVYDDCHLGHARCYVSFDVIRRYLIRRGYDVTHVQNFTDIDDKIIQRAAERGEDPLTLAREYEKRYFEVFDRLGVRRADRYPRATEEIEGMIALIGRLIEKNHAYPSDGDVYFSTSSFAGYGKLSKRTPESMMAGARVEISEKKRDPLDFALWKKSKPGEPSWPSPWGDGRPGWHIECSVMSGKYLGDTLDIHGGGQDLIFPHHENEIAQSEAASGKPFVRYFLHNGFVTVDGEKMSKSLGNFRTLEELYRQVDPMILRFFILSTHYRSPLTFTAKKLQDAEAGLSRLREGRRHLTELLKLKISSGSDVEPGLAEWPAAVQAEFEDAMDDDFNTAEAIGAIFRMLSRVNQIYDRRAREGTVPAELSGALKKIAAWIEVTAADVLGVSLNAAPAPAGDSGEIEKLLAGRDAARKEKRYADADRIRDEIARLGYQIQDTPLGPRAVKKSVLT